MTIFCEDSPQANLKSPISGEDIRILPLAGLDPRITTYRREIVRSEGGYVKIQAKAGASPEIFAQKS